MNIKVSEMSWQEFNKKSREKVLILPVGSSEQHGPHLPLSVDSIISSSLAEMVAQKVDGIVAPTILYGYKSQPGSGGGPLFPGTFDISGNTFSQLLKEILKEFLRDDVFGIFILNGHFENEPFILEAVDEIFKERDVNTKIIVGSWWDQISEDTMNKVFDEIEFPGWELEHAAIAETSLMMKFRPDLVHLDLVKEEVVHNVKNYHSYPISKDLVHPSGMLFTSKSSSPEKGDLLAEDIVNHFSEIIFKEIINK